MPKPQKKQVCFYPKPWLRVADNQDQAMAQLTILSPRIRMLQSKPSTMIQKTTMTSRVKGQVRDKVYLVIQ